MRLDILGPRGSVPSPGTAFAGIGGNTSCIAITADGDDGPTLVLDAGTGLAGLDRLLGGRPFRGTLALTHLHWDHVIGLPFATAIDRPDARVHLLLPSEGAEPRTLLGQMMGPPFFPIALSGLAGQIDVHEIAPSVREVGRLRLEARWLAHGRGRALGFRVDDAHMSVAYLPDHGPARLDASAIDPDALALCTGVDVLLHDAHFAPGEEQAAVRAGHSTAGFALDLARAAGVGRLLLFHHHPRRTDDQVERLVAGLKGSGVEVDAAREGKVGGGL